MAKQYVSSNSALISSTVTVTRKHRTPVGTTIEFEVEAEYLDRKKATPEDFGEAALQWRDVEEATNRCFSELNCGAIIPEEVVYLIAPKGANYCKIGMTNNPLKRLREIQICCWDRLYICGLFWVLEGTAIGLEQLSLRVAKRTGMDMRGEWIGTNPAGAAYIVGSTAHSVPSLKIADSAMWVRQRDALDRRIMQAETGLAAA